MAAVREELRRRNAQAGALVERKAKEKCPVGTPESTGVPGYVGGRLRASITHDADETGAVVGTNVTYGKHVELGTRRMDPQPFLVPALRESEDEIKRLYERNS